MAQGAAAEDIPSSNRQAARERAFRLLAVTVTALFLAFAALGGAFVWYDRAAGWLNHTHEVRVEIEALMPQELQEFICLHPHRRFRLHRATRHGPHRGQSPAVGARRPDL